MPTIQLRLTLYTPPTPMPDGLDAESMRNIIAPTPPRPKPSVGVERTTGMSMAPSVVVDTGATPSVGRSAPGVGSCPLAMTASTNVRAVAARRARAADVQLYGRMPDDTPRACRGRLDLGDLASAPRRRVAVSPISRAARRDDVPCHDRAEEASNATQHVERAECLALPIGLRVPECA